MQFPKRFWRATGRPRAFGSPLSFGALWEANEEQPGKPGILALLAGGSASDATAGITAREGVGGLARSLDWLGAHGHDVTGLEAGDVGGRAMVARRLRRLRLVVRADAARLAGAAVRRLFFAGEHTSITWQGYMNGAVESGQRAAAEVAAAHRITI